MKDANELLKEIDEDAQKMLSEKRYIHCKNVMKRAVELAKIYGINENKAMLAGFAHDITKEMPKDEMFKYIEEHNIKIDEFEKKNPGLLHGKIAAVFCKEKYGFTEDMQKALEYHTTGEPDMDDLAKIVFIADKTEVGRKNNDWEKIREKEKEGLDALLLYVIDESICYVIKKGKQIRVDTILTRNYLLEKMK